MFQVYILSIFSNIFALWMVVRMTCSSTSHLSHTQKLEQSDMLPQGHHHTPLKYVLCPPPLVRTSSQGRPSLSFILTSFTSSWRSVRDWRKQLGYAE